MALVVAGATAATTLLAGAAAGQGPTPSPSPSPTRPPGSPSQIELVFELSSPPDPSRPCSSGSTFHRQGQGATADLIVCTFDEAGNPTSTETDGTRLIWGITSFYPVDYLPVRFTSAPPTETGPSGTASAMIEALNHGNSYIVVELRTSDYMLIDRALVEHNVDHAEYVPRVTAQVEVERVAGGLRGRVVTENPCREAREILIWLRDRPVDQLEPGSVFTNRRGRWKATLESPGTYYVEVPEAHRRGRPGVRCTSDTSSDVRVTRSDIRAG